MTHTEPREPSDATTGDRARRRRTRRADPAVADQPARDRPALSGRLAPAVPEPSRTRVPSDPEPLLDLAYRLADAADVTAVAERLAEAIPHVVGSRSGVVLLWDPSLGQLQAVAAVGHEEAQRRHLLQSTLDVEATPEIGRLLARQEPVVITAATASPELSRLLESIGSVRTVAVPLLAGETLMGVATASWGDASAVPDDEAALMSRLVAVCLQGATALENRRLLVQVRHQSQHDALTGLPNRRRFTRALDDVLRGATPEVGTCVLVCDLDRFKRVNEDLGHGAGDELLRQAAGRLREQLRAGDTVGRLNGDEFAIVLAGMEHHEAVSVAERVVESLDSPFRIDGREVRITVSVGVAVHVGPDGRGENLLAAADEAMRAAKERGRSQVVVAGDLPARPVVPSLEAELGRAVADDQLRLFFQPLVDLTSEQDGVVGAEALLRWAHPRLGLLAPGAFLPLAEESGLISELDLWAVEAACAALGEVGTEPPLLRMAVNLASATLVDPRLMPTVRQSLAAHGIDPSRLHLEVVESRSLVDLPGVLDAMAGLRQIGVRISLDDFGTGYSTLSWLHSLPVDQIKIDRSFVMRLPSDGASVAVVRGVLALARELGIEVVAEGVEDSDQLSTLREAGCAMVQGYLLGRPGPVLTTSLRSDHEESATPRAVPISTAR